MMNKWRWTSLIFAVLLTACEVNLPTPPPSGSTATPAPTATPANTATPQPPPNTATPQPTPTRVPTPTPCANCVTGIKSGPGLTGSDAAYASGPNVDLSLDRTEWTASSYTFSNGANPTQQWLFDLSGGTDPNVTWESGLTASIDFAGTIQQNNTNVALESRNINTTSPIGGGGNLSADRTITCTTCVTSVTASGAIASSGGTTPAITCAACASLAAITSNHVTGSANFESISSGGSAPNLGFSVTSGHTYHFRFVIIWESSATANGVVFAVNGPTTSLSIYKVSNQNVADGSVGTDGFSERTEIFWNTGTALTTSPEATTEQIAIIEGVAITTGNGTITATVKSENAPASTITVLVGSVGYLTQVA